MSDFRREYLLRLPLPLAQLYSRAYNAKGARSRHDNGFYLFEALTKLGAAIAITAYLREVEHGEPRITALDQQLACLAQPSFGQWVALLAARTRPLLRRQGRRCQPSTGSPGATTGPEATRPARA